jgi:hypothetical protein
MVGTFTFATGIFLICNSVFGDRRI